MKLKLVTFRYKRGLKLSPELEMFIKKNLWGNDFEIHINLQNYFHSIE